MKKNSGNELAPSKAFNLLGLVDYVEDSIVSRELKKTEAGTLTLFAFDAEQGLSEHSAPFDAFVQVLEGELEITIAGEPVMVKSGQIVLMPADIPHGLTAKEKSKFLLTMFKK